LNFNTSTMFSPGEQDDIHLRCYYKISLCNFVDKSLFDIPICKEAHCRAWLGGDDNPVKVSQQAAVQPAPERTMPEQADANEAGDEESDGDETAEEDPLPFEDDDDVVSDEDEEAFYGILGQEEEEEKENSVQYYASYEEYLANHSISEEEARILLNDDGVFASDELEQKYQEYVRRNTRDGKPVRDRLDWKNASDYWTKYSYMARGNNFNHAVWESGRYAYNEVQVGRYRLDSYDPVKGEIVSRKATDLENITDATFIGYLEEFEEKYKVGTPITTRKDDYEDLYTEYGGVLQGEYILEVPATNENIENIEHFKELAAQYNVTIRFTDEKSP
ncbi:MAG: hypothetical protein J5717_03775, partial [Lachnospiraceae bacterium]|nr:hypothetical protein [Lachnospiraceae bacterium]